MARRAASARRRRSDRASRPPRSSAARRRGPLRPAGRKILSCRRAHRVRRPARRRRPTASPCARRGRRRASRRALWTRTARRCARRAAARPCRRGTRPSCRAWRRVNTPTIPVLATRVVAMPAARSVSSTSALVRCSSKPSSGCSWMRRRQPTTSSKTRASAASVIRTAALWIGGLARWCARSRPTSFGGPSASNSCPLSVINTSSSMRTPMPLKRGSTSRSSPM